MMVTEDEIQLELMTREVSDLNQWSRVGFQCGVVRMRLYRLRTLEVFQGVRPRRIVLCFRQ